MKLTDTALIWKKGENFGASRIRYGDQWGEVEVEPDVSKAILGGKRGRESRVISDDLGPPSCLVARPIKSQKISHETIGCVDYQNRASPDAGGCMLLALNKSVPGVLSATELDEQIHNVHKEMNTYPEWTPDKFQLEWCGTPGESWHQDCIAKALKKNFSHGYT